LEAQLSAAIVRLEAAELNIPEADCCGEAVEGAAIWLRAEENLSSSNARLMLALISIP
jgi:hypothetical protein